MPAHFIARPDARRAFLDRGLTPPARATVTEAEANAGVRAVSVILGMGGVGKSAFAAALAHDPALVDEFPDGVLWAPLGQQPDLLPLLSGWVQALGDYQFQPLSLEAATGHLRTLLHDKAVLLVVDDAWAPAHVAPFLVGGPRCLVLITTREAAIARTLGIAPFDLDVLTPVQSLGLLTGRLGRPLVDDEREPAAAVAAAVGRLPLALELAAAQVADGVPWSELRDDLTREVAELSSLDLPGAADEAEDALRKRLSLLASFHLSLRRLSEPERRDFAWLGVLAEDAPLNPTMAATLWQTDVRTARATLRVLRDRGLLLLGVTQPDGTPTYRLHDLLHDLARRLLTDPAAPRPGAWPGLGLTWREAHSHWLDRYRARAQDGGWHTVSDDGYFCERLTFHLEQAGRGDEIHALLREESSAGGNGWYEARERLGQFAGYLTDLGRALALADRESSAPSLRVGRCCRYALLTASLGSRAGNVLPDLLDATVEQGVWPPAQALAYARRIPNRVRRAQALDRLIPRLHGLGLEPEPILREALEGAQDQRADVLIALARHLPPPAIEEALTAVRASRDESWQVDALAALAPWLTPDQLGQALGMLPTMEPHATAEALAALVDHLPETWLPTALEVACRIRHDWARAEALTALAHRLSSSQLDRARRSARAIKTAWPRARALVALTRLASPEDQAKAQTAARALDTTERRAEALATLAVHAPPEDRDQRLRDALAEVRACDSDSDRAEALTAVAPYLTRSVVDEAFEIAQRIGTKWERDKALLALAPHLTSALLEPALQSIRTSPSELSQVEFLAALPHDLLTTDLCDEALDKARSIAHDQSRAESLAALAPRLSGPRLARALKTSQAVGDEETRVETLVALTKRLELPAERDRILDDALTLAATIEDEPRRSRVLILLAPQLGSQAAERARALAQAIGHVWSREQALAALARRPDPTADRLNLETLQRSGAGLREVMALTALKHRMKTPGLDAVSAGDGPNSGLTADERETVLREALATAPSIEDEAWRVEAILALAPRLAPGLLTQALAVVRDIDDKKLRTRALIHLVPYLPPGRVRVRVLRDALRLARTVKDLSWRVEALSAIVPLVDPPDRDAILRDALTTAGRIMREHERAEALAELAPRLTPSLLAESLALAGTLADESSRSSALTALAPRLAELDAAPQFSLWNHLLQRAAAWTRPSLLRDLRALAPTLQALGGDAAVVETCRAIQDAGRWWP